MVRRKTRASGRAAFRLVVVDISSQDVLAAFADISTFLKERGRSIGDNDRWIAATARVLQATVLAVDRHFSVLSPEMVASEVIVEGDLMTDF